MTSMHRLALVAGLSAGPLSGSVQESSPGQAQNRCAGQTACAEVPAFVAMVTEVRAGAGATLAVTVRFTNKTPRPLVVGYTDGSGAATDGRGGRLLLVPAAVQGIGIISRSGFDPKLTLQPGASGDARFEFGGPGGGGADAATSLWSVELTIREIDPVANHQYKLGKEHPLQFRGLRVAGAPPD